MSSLWYQTRQRVLYFSIHNGWSYPDYNSETAPIKWAFVPFKLWYGRDKYTTFWGFTVLSFEFHWSWHWKAGYPE